MATTPVNIGTNAPVLTPEMRAALLQAQQQQAMPTPVLPDAALLAATPAQQQLSRVQVDPVQQQAAALQAEAPQAQQKPGALKSFLSNFLLGAGDGMRKHVGLPTEQEEARQKQQLAIQQQQADTQEAYRADQGKLINTHVQQLEAQLAPVTIAADDMTVPEQFRGGTHPASVVNAIRQIQAKSQGTKDVAQLKAENALDLETLKQAGGNPKDHQITSIGGRRVMVSKRDGSILKDLGVDTAMITGPMNAEARARAMAKYGVANVMDADMNPTAISRLDQLRTGAPTMTEKATQTLSGDRVGVETYLGASKLVEDNLHILRDPVQRAIIARATDAVEHDPGAISSIISAYSQQGLAPEGAALIGGMKQMNEFGPSFKKYGGNSGVVTDSLRNVIHSNQASAQNAEATNRQLIKQDRELAAKVSGILGKPGKYAVPVRGGSDGTSTLPATAPTDGGNDPFAAFGGRAR